MVTNHGKNVNISATFLKLKKVSNAVNDLLHIHIRLLKQFLTVNRLVKI